MTAIVPVQEKDNKVKDFPDIKLRAPQTSIVIETMEDYVPDLRSRYVIDGLLYKNEVSVAFGPSNVGKTAVVLRLVQHVLDGEQVLGEDVRPGLVAYVAAESPFSVKRRLDPILRNKATRQNCLVVGGTPNLLDRAYVEELVARLQAHAAQADLPVVLVVFDTVALSIGYADENDNAQMGAVIAAARSIAEAMECHVLLVHHSGKDSDRGSRGASSLRCNSDTELALFLQMHGDGKTETLKQRNDRKGELIGYSLRPEVIGQDERGKDVTVVVADLKKVSPNCALNGQSAKTTPPLHIAIETALHIRGKNGVTEMISDEIHALLPASMFLDVDQEKQIDRVSRACDAMSSAGILLKGKRGRNNLWSLAKATSTPSGEPTFTSPSPAPLT